MSLATQSQHDHLELTRKCLRENFLADSRPWIIAYSGGKDSTLVLQLVYELLQSLPESQRKPVHVLSSDTRVEAPNIKDYVENSLRSIGEHARFSGLDLVTHLIRPEAAEGFWVNLIGKGYPPPTRWFRWCTTRMKIRPVTKVIEEICGKSGSAILLLGTRYSESASRGRAMDARKSNDRGLNPHHEIPNALVLSPISHWNTDQVWEYLFMNNPPPWGGSHDFMLALYRQANGGECPVVTDLNTPSCGGSRFGCWTCTVVKADKSMQGFIETGDEWMRPLNDFRNWLKEMREDENNRQRFRRDGRPGIGPFTSEARKNILDKLLELEKSVGIRLIDDEELRCIQSIWDEEFDLMKSALKLSAKNGRFPNRMVGGHYA